MSLAAQIISSDDSVAHFCKYTRYSYGSPIVWYYIIMNLSFLLE